MSRPAGPEHDGALRRLQQQMRDAILADAAPAGLLAAGAPDTARRFAVYAHAYRARLLAALRDNYPVLAAALGDDAFEALGHAYLAAHPSQHASIRWFGDALAGFMAGDTRTAHPALVDLARMEWALRAAFDAAALPPLQVEHLAALAPEAWPDLRLTLQPAVQRLPLDWAVEPLWHALTADPDAATTPPAALTHTLLICRPGLDTRFRSLDPLEAMLLDAAADGAPFAALCEQAATFTGDDTAAATAAGLLRRWIDDNLLAAPS